MVKFLRTATDDQRHGSDNGRMTFRITICAAARCFRRLSQGVHSTPGIAGTNVRLGQKCKHPGLVIETGTPLASSFQ